MSSKQIKKFFKSKQAKKILREAGKVLKPASRALKAKVKQDLTAAIQGTTMSGSGRYQRMRGKGLYRPTFAGSGLYRGSGSYEKVNNLIAGGPAPMQVTVGRHSETGNILISKREYLFDVFSPATPANFTPFKFSANPGISSLGPFVAQIASNYDKYRYRQLIFTYNPVVTDSSSTGQMGSLLMAFNPNVSAAAFSTKQQMAEYSDSISGRVCDTLVMGVECDYGASDWLYVRTGSVPTGQDAKTYDFGALHIATSGVSAASFPAATQLGEVWVEYTVELANPKLYDALGYTQAQDVFFGTVGITSSIPLGTSPSKSTANTLGCQISKTSGTVIVPDNFSGWIRIMYFSYASSATFTSISFTGNFTDFNDMVDSAGASSAQFKNNAASVNCYVVRDVYVSFASTANGNTFTLNIGVLTAATSAYLAVCQINPAMGPPAGVSTNFVPV